MASAESSALDEQEEYRNKNQDVNGGCDHSADDGGGDWLHHIGTNAGFPEDGREAENDRGYGHQLGPQPLHSAFNDGLQ